MSSRSSSQAWAISGTSSLKTKQKKKVLGIRGQPCFLVAISEHSLHPITSSVPNCAEHTAGAQCLLLKNSLIRERKCSMLLKYFLSIQISKQEPEEELLS